MPPMRAGAPAVHVLIPMKRPDLCKTRLSGVLPDECRIRLVLAMMSQTMRAVSQCGHGLVSVSQASLVVPGGAPATSSPRPAGGGERRPLRWDVVNDRGEGMNRALELAVDRCATRGAAYVAVLPVDLPFITPGAVRRVIHSAIKCGGHVIVPDARRTGTNALCVRADRRFPLGFGSDSFATHRRSAGKTGVEVRVLSDTLLAYDLDTGDDLAWMGPLCFPGVWSQSGHDGRCRTWCGPWCGASRSFRWKASP